MSKVEEMKLDVEELQKLHQTASRVRVKDLLDLQIKKLETEISNELAATNQEAEVLDNETKAPVAQKVPVQAQTYYSTITTYAWDQSEKFMKLYVTLPGVQSIAKENVSSEYSERGFKMQVKDLNGKNQQLVINNLLYNINTTGSYHKVKTDMVLVMLKKEEPNKSWTCVTAGDKKAKDMKAPPKVDETEDPSGNLMGMLKQMYDDGDDDMKRTIAKAWTESRDKKGDAPML